MWLKLTSLYLKTLWSNNMYPIPSDSETQSFNEAIRESRLIQNAPYGSVDAGRLEVLTRLIAEYERKYYGFTGAEKPRHWVLYGHGFRASPQFEGKEFSVNHPIAPDFLEFHNPNSPFEYRSIDERWWTAHYTCYEFQFPANPVANGYRWVRTDGKRYWHPCVVL
jgi:hypothetical protein